MIDIMVTLARRTEAGEQAARKALRDLHNRRLRMRNAMKALRRAGREISPAVSVKVDRQIEELDRLARFTALALARLPEERVSRAKAVHSLLEDILALNNN